MSKRIALACTLGLGLSLLAVGAWKAQDAKPAETGAARAATPVDGYTVHVTAPHVVNGHIMGPYHHYCKVITPDPFIVCQIYNSADPNGVMSQIEFIVAKKLTRPKVDLNDWNRLWHDHTQEIATGRVQVLDLPPDKAKQVADLVATTDGIIYHFDFANGLPDGKILHAQSVGHRPLTAAEYEQSRKEVMVAAK